MKKDLRNAQLAAEKLVNKLTPFCSDIAVTGSVYRGEDSVDQLDVVWMPIKSVLVAHSQLSLFDDPASIRWTRSRQTGYETVLEGYELVAMGKSVRRYVLPDEQLPFWLWYADQNNFGWVKLLTSCTSDYLNSVLRPALQRRGVYQKQGFLFNRKGLISVATEREVYEHAGLTVVDWYSPKAHQP